MGVLMVRKRPDRKAPSAESSSPSAAMPELLDGLQMNGNSAEIKRMLPDSQTNGTLQNGHAAPGHLPNGESADGSSSSNSSDEADNSSASKARAKAAKGLRGRRSWMLRMPKRGSAEAEDVAGADTALADPSSKSMTEGSTRRRGGMRDMLRALKPPSTPSPFASEQPASRSGSVREDRRKGAKAGKQAPAEPGKLEDPGTSQSFTVESSYSSAATSRAHSLEVGENPPALEAGATGKPGPPEKKGHSRSRSWVAAVTAPFSRSASGAMKSAEEGESGKGEKPAQSPRGSLDGQPSTAPPTPEQPKPLGTAISCLNIFPGAKGSASDSEWETIEPSKGSSLKHPLPLPPLKNIGNTCFMNANLQMLLHAPPVQAVLCSMPVPPPPSDGPPTPRAEEPSRSPGNPSLVPSTKAEEKADLGAAGSTEPVDTASAMKDHDEAAVATALQPCGNHSSIGAPSAGQNSPVDSFGPETVMCSCSPERAVLPSIEEHPEAAKVPSAAQPVQAQAPGAPEEAPLTAGMTVKTSVEDAPYAGDADADSSRSHTPVSLMGVATPDIAHPPSAVEVLQRGHQPWASSEAPAKLLQTGVAGSGAEDSTAHAAPLCPEEPTAAQDRVADSASIQGNLPRSAEAAAVAEAARRNSIQGNLSRSAEAAAVAEAARRASMQGNVSRSAEAAAVAAAAQRTEPDAAGGELRPNIALPPPAALPALKPGELFVAFRRFAHETLTAPSDEPVNPEALVKTFFRTEIGTPFSNGGQHDTEESLREFMRALEADMAACHSKEHECLMGSACLCKMQLPAPALPTVSESPASMAEPAQAPALQLSTELPKGKAGERKAEETDRKGKDGAKKAKEDGKRAKDEAKKGEDSDKKAKEAARKELSEEALRKEAAKGDKRWVHDTASKLPFEMLFTGQEQSSSTCPKCGSMSTMYDVSTMLTLSLTKKQEGWWAAMLARKAPLTLQDCLQGYTQEETLPADDFVMCDDCKEKTKDRKALKLHRVPEVLLIMLKRTMYPSTEKDDRHITFPLEGLDFTPYMSEASAIEGSAPYTYDLAGVCAHDGKSVNCGHYRAVCRRPATCPEEQDAWYMYDDDKPAQLLKPEQVSSQIAYVLCYCRSSKGAADRSKRIDAPV